MTDEEQQVIKRLELSESNLARSRKGQSDTSASDTKSPLLMNGEELAEKTAQNMVRLYELLFELKKKPRPESVSHIKNSLRSIEDTINDGLLPRGR